MAAGSELDIMPILQKLAAMETTQEHILGEISEIKESIKELKNDNSKRDGRIEKLELHNANEAGKRDISIGVISFIIAVVVAVITALVMKFVGGA